MIVSKTDFGDSAEMTGPGIQQAMGPDGSPDEVVPTLIKLGKTKQEAGHHQEAEDLFRKALAIGEQALGPDDPRLIPALTNLGGIRLSHGSPTEAEPLLARALSITEGQLGPDHPDLVILLNDFTRLYLKNAAYACAEPLLQRLLTLKRSKGEDHPEVATVLASLATARQGLGHHESAEQLWKRVLEIRERTLAPNHFAIVTALEHLAASCAARGKLQTSLTLLKRAQGIRELTLGADHASLRPSRERIADLELQASEDGLDPQSEATLNSTIADAPISIPDNWRLVPTERRTPVAFPPPHIRSSVIRGWNAVPMVEREDRSNQREDRSNQQEDRSNQGIDPIREPQALRAWDDEQDTEADAENYRNFVENIRRHLGQADEPEPVSNSMAVFVTSTFDFLRKQRREVMSVAVVLLVLLIAVASGSWASSENESLGTETALSESAAIPVSPVAKESSRGIRSASNPIEIPGLIGTSVINSRSTVSSPPPQQPQEPVNQRDRRMSTARTVVPALPTGLIMQLDSVVGGVKAPALTVGEPSPIVMESSPANTSFAKLLGVDVEEDPNPSSLIASRQPARLIGTLPTPRVPGYLTDIEGEVRVLFDVDVNGRPVMSTFSVAASPHEGLSASVRRAVGQMRFEPARIAGPGSKPVVGNVQIRYTFSKTKGVEQ